MLTILQISPVCWSNATENIEKSNNSQLLSISADVANASVIL